MSDSDRNRVVHTPAILNLHKPSGITSRDAVNRVQRLVRPAKVGHAGTLDPLASGVLVVAIGGATRLIEFVQQLPKRYYGTFLLGRSSDTEDISGEVQVLPGARAPSLEELQAAATRLTGPILQRPPVYSALKVAGRRAYDLARRGATPELAPRPINIHELDIVRYEYPVVELEVACSSGTYVRSLGRDLAESVGTAAVMSALVRTAIGGFRIEDACNFDALNAETLAKWKQPVNRAVEHLPRYELTSDETRAVRQGKQIPPRLLSGAAIYAAFDPHGELVGTLVPTAEGMLRTERNLPHDSERL